MSSSPKTSRVTYDQSSINPSAQFLLAAADSADGTSNSTFESWTGLEVRASSRPADGQYDLTQRPSETDEGEGERERECGFVSCRPTCIQGCASIKSFTFFCCVLVTVQGLLSGGYLPSVISTLERRYDIRSGLSSLIPSSYEVGNLFTVIFVSYLGTRRHIPFWIGIGVLVMGAGSILFSVPHFMSGKYYDGITINANGSDHIQDTICQPAVTLSSPGPNALARPCISPCDSSIKDLPSHSNRIYIFIFIVAQIFTGGAGSPIFTLGSTYIDDHVKKENSAMYLGCMYTMVALGPVLGFLLGGFLLRIHVDVFHSDGHNFSLDSSSKNWIGAWWGGFLLCGGFLFALAIPFFAFPKSLSGEKAKLTLADKEERKNDSFASLGNRSGDATEEKQEYGKNLQGIPRALYKLLSNPIYMVTCWGACMELVIISGFCVFLPKYLETQFDVSRADANMLVGGIIPGACLGIWVGGWLLKKLELQPMGAVRLLITCNLVSLTMFSALFMFGCDNIKIAGATTDYHNSSLLTSGPFIVNLTSPCNMGCRCSENQLELICGSDGLTYISPCHAGCKRFAKDSSAKLANFSDCACIGNEFLTTTGATNELRVKPLATGTTGSCPRACSMLIPFMVLVFIMSFTVAVAQMPSLMLTMRTVAVEERSLAIGLQFVFFRLLAYIPAPIAFGNIIDTTCLLWKSSGCGATSGGCLLYDIEMFRFKYVGIGAGFKVLALLLFTLDYWLIRRRVIGQRREETDLPNVRITAADVITTSLTSLSCLDHHLQHGNGRCGAKHCKLPLA